MKCLDLIRYNANTQDKLCVTLSRGSETMTMQPLMYFNQILKLYQEADMGSTEEEEEEEEEEDFFNKMFIKIEKKSHEHKICRQNSPKH